MNNPSFDTTFICDANVRPRKSEDASRDVAFGRVLVEGVWHTAFCPQSVTRRMQPQKGGTYAAKAIVNPKADAKNARYMLCRIDGPKQPALSDMAQSNILGFLSQVGVSHVTEITEHLWAEHDVTEADVWIALQGMWREGSVSRIAMARDASSPDCGTMWAAQDFELQELIDG